MKPIKMLGLAALAALMAMAFVGASSAMAESTTLCAIDGTECESVAHIHETTTKKAILLASPEIQCDVLFLGDVTPGAPAIVTGNFTYSNCGTSCSVEEEGGPSVIKVLKEGHETSKVTGEGEVHVNCIGINCYYNGEELVGTGKGPLLSTAANGEVNITGQKVKKVKGLFCPSEGKLDINTTPLSATYINSGLGYCAETEHTVGVYTNSTCTTVGGGVPEHKYKYALVVTTASIALNEIRCYRTLGMLTKKYGLWNAGCSIDDVNKESDYEKGKVVSIH